MTSLTSLASSRPRANTINTPTNAASMTSKPHKCNSCEKAYTRIDGLKRHIQTVHEGHKDHKCEVCSKSFSMAHHLKKHIHAVHKAQMQKSIIEQHTDFDK